MWKTIGIPVVIYLVFVFYIYQPSSTQNIPVAELIKQLPTDQVELYIHQHAPLAIQEMQRAKIPASITLAQAILESKYGTSELAQQANNHFGIKAGTEWGTVNRFCIHSDEWNPKKQKMIAVLSCFRKYSAIADCYENHSDFLTNRPYYTQLFTLDIQNYKAWAEGLQKAGYATDPQYADKLIALIERYQLNECDQTITT